VPGADETADSFREPRYTRLLVRAPSLPLCAGYAALASVVTAALAAFPRFGSVAFLPVLLYVFLGPALLAGLITSPLAGALGGRLSWRRSFLLAATATAVPLPILVVERLLVVVMPSAAPPTGVFLLFLLGPVLWFRHMSLFGLSRPDHARSLPASLAQPVLSFVGVLFLVPPTAQLVTEGAIFLLFGFLGAAVLLRAADRPLRREFGTSGVALIRPVLDHINLRDPGATAELEGFFARFSIAADLRLTLIAIRSSGRTKATIVLPTVHPGPFATLGASDLPRKLIDRLGPDGGMVFAPHTPCNHDLDLPTAADVAKVGDAAAGLLKSLPPTGVARAGPLVRSAPDSFARGQRLGDAVLVTVTQAPAATDDIDFAIVDPLLHPPAPGAPRLALIDAHNSYVEGQGDLTYATPNAAKLRRDIEAAVTAADAAAVDGPFRFGVAARTDYDLRAHGIGPSGIRAWVVEVAGNRTAHVLIDGNNLIRGLRAPILEALAPLVTDAEVMTTDNHIVHEVDGGINPVGERYPGPALARDVKAVVAAAIADLSEATAVSGSVTIPSVRVLQPAWTQRLLTSLGDTVSVFGNTLLTTYLLVVTSSLVVLLALLR
jgi:putative membrane protein